MVSGTKSIVDSLLFTDTNILAKFMKENFKVVNMPTSLSIASGKGGVGKTTVAINLAIVQAKISSCLLLDADMGMANAHILLGINPELTIKDFFDGSCSLEEVITSVPLKD